MKIKYSLDKFEKVILILAISAVLILIVFGFFYSANKKTEPYVSNYSEDNVIVETDEVTLKQDTFTMQRNGSLDNDPADYFNGSAENLRQIQLNLSEVNTLQVGSYHASATLNDTVYEFTINVEESQNPYLSAENQNFRFFIGNYSTIEEVIDIAGVTATDIDGNDISEDIVGWPDTLPDTYGETTYRLSVTDMYGNVGYIYIVVNYQEVVY